MKGVSFTLLGALTSLYFHNFNQKHLRSEIMREKHLLNELHF